MENGTNPETKDIRPQAPGPKASGSETSGSRPIASGSKASGIETKGSKAIVEASGLRPQALSEAKATGQRPQATGEAIGLRPQALALDYKQRAFIEYYCMSLDAPWAYMQAYEVRNMHSATTGAHRLLGLDIIREGVSAQLQATLDVSKIKLQSEANKILKGSKSDANKLKAIELLLKTEGNLKEDKGLQQVAVIISKEDMTDRLKAAGYTRQE